MSATHKVTFSLLKNIVLLHFNNHNMAHRERETECVSVCIQVGVVSGIDTGWQRAGAV